MKLLVKKPQLIIINITNTVGIGIDYREVMLLLQILLLLLSFCYLHSISLLAEKVT